MTLLELHAELAETNLQLKRIADALERAAPQAIPDVAMGGLKHPLIGKSDVSVMTPEHAIAAEYKRATMPMTQDHNVKFGEQHQDERTASEGPSPSRSGEWDHDDPLDDFPERGDEWANYAGVDQ